tara:strand:+ start:995 stop:1807 length:813 start_codon:yes stop_codon:yes gene_type:complete
MKKILTVLIPTYNSYECFLKVIKNYQEDNRVKIMVSDDSDDNYEKELIKAHCVKNQINYIKGPNSSAVKNWNKLLQKIDTPFFVLNHHDDYPNNLEFLDQLAEERIGLIILPCSSKVTGKNIHNMSSWQQKIFTKICLLFPNASLNMILAPTAALVLNSKFRNIYFDENLTWFVDAEWYLKLFLSTKILNLKTIFFNKSRIISIQNKDSITIKLKENLKKHIINEKHYLSSKGLYPGCIINAIQFCLLGLILLSSKIKQLLAKTFISKFI